MSRGSEIVPPEAPAPVTPSEGSAATSGSGAHPPAWLQSAARVASVGNPPAPPEFVITPEMIDPLFVIPSPEFDPVSSRSVTLDPEMVQRAPKAPAFPVTMFPPFATAVPTALVPSETIRGWAIAVPLAKVMAATKTDNPCFMRRTPVLVGARKRPRNLIGFCLDIYEVEALGAT